MHMAICQIASCAFPGAPPSTKLGPTSSIVGEIYQGRPPALFTRCELDGPNDVPVENYKKYEHRDKCYHGTNKQ